MVITGTTSFKSGTCQAYTITSKDANNTTANMSATLTVNLTDGAALGAFYSDNVCSAGITSTTIAAASSAAIVYYLDNTAQSITISADDAAAAVTSGTLALTSGPDRLLLGTATSFLSGACQVYTVTAKDAAGNSANALADITVNLTDGAAAGAFYSDNVCGSLITTKTITGGTNVSTIYYKDNTAEAITLSAADNAASLATSTLSVTTQPDHLAITGSSSFKSGTCQAYTVTSKDAANANANVAANLTVNLSDGVASGVFYSDNVCSAVITASTILAASSSTIVYYQNNTAESATLNADDAAVVVTSGTISVTVGPDHLLLAGTTTIKAGVCQAYTVTTKDANNATKGVTSALTINLTDGAGAGSYYSDAGCTAGITTASIALAGSTVTVYYKDNTAENVTLSAADNAGSLTASTLGIAMGPDRITITGTTPILSGTCGTYTVKTKDAASADANVLGATTINMTDGAALGSFFSENTCTTGTTTVSFASGDNTQSVWYKNTTAESATLSAADNASSLTTGTLAIATGPDRLVWTGSAAPTADACTIYSISSKDATNTNANVLANTTIDVTGIASGAFYSDAACTLPITQASISSGTFGVNIYYKNALGEGTTFNADDGVGNMTAGTKVINVDCGATSFNVALASGAGTIASGASYDVTITAKAAGLTKTCYVGSHSISWTITGNTAGSFDCGETSGAPVAPTETALTFTNGVATTTSGVAKFKQVQANATVAASDGSISGTSSNIAVTVGPVCRIYLRSAASNGGVSYTGANLDLNLSASQDATSASTAYATGFDAYGQYVSNPTVKWTGTGSVYPWQKTTNNADDTAKVYGVKVGTGTLQADYNGGGTYATATASYTVSSTNGTGTIASNTWDSAGLAAQLGSSTVYETKYWYASGDSTTAWMTDSTKGWYSEAFSASRGSRKAFPSRAFLIANANGLDILDATNNHLYMRFTVGALRALDSAYGNVVSAKGLNGKIYVTMRDAGATTGTFVVLDFVNNTVYRYGTGGKYLWNGGGLQNRNSGSTWAAPSATPALAGNTVYRTSVRQIGAIDYVLIGTNAGVTLYQDNAGTISTYKDLTGSPVVATDITSDGKLYYAENTNGVLRYDATLPLSGDWAPSRTYTNSTKVNLGLKNLTSLEVAEGTSAATGGAHTILTGTNEGLSIIQEHTTFGSETSNNYTTASTGNLSFANQLNFNGVAGTASFDNTTVAARNFTYEAFVRPGIDFSTTTPAAYIIDRGALGTDSYGMRFNSAGDGKMECYAYKGAVVTTAASTTTSWTKGRSYHLACQFDNVTNDMKVTIYVDGVPQTSATINNMNTWNGSIGKIYLGSRGGTANFLNGSIDELRISNISRYTVTFTVPTAAFVTDGNTVVLNHFDDLAGNLATATTGNNANLNTTAWFSKPLLAGTSNAIADVAATVISSGATAEVVSSGATGAWSELTSAGTASPALNTSATSITGQSIDIYQVDAATDSDIVIGLTSTGIRLQRR